jgi:hypothetical protein
VSTVLRPVGPLSSRVYWIRRAVLVLALLVLVIAIAVSCSGGSAKKPTGAAGKPDPQQTSSQPAQPPACDATALKLSVSTDTVTYTSGQAPKLIGTFSNPTTTTCRLARAVSAEIWTIKSGTPTVWTTQGCPGSAVPAHAKILAGGTRLVSIFWDGHVRGSDCKDAAVAAAGTYRLYATLDGVQQTKPAVFHITS